MVAVVRHALDWVEATSSLDQGLAGSIGVLSGITFAQRARARKLRRRLREVERDRVALDRLVGVYERMSETATQTRREIDRLLERLTG
jgi:hypothetical protein